MNNKKTAEITLVGAGPGSADLITIRGLKALKRADVILYDALISRDLLKLAKKKHTENIRRKKMWSAFVHTG